MGLLALLEALKPAGQPASQPGLVGAVWLAGWLAGWLAWSQYYITLHYITTSRRHRASHFPALYLARTYLRMYCGNISSACVTAICLFVCILRMYVTPPYSVRRLFFSSLSPSISHSLPVLSVLALFSSLARFLLAPSIRHWARVEEAGLTTKSL